jgi:hypothetical protein
VRSELTGALREAVDELELDVAYAPAHERPGE